MEDTALDEAESAWWTDYQALCVTVVRGQGPDAVAAAIARDGVRVASLEDAEDWVFEGDLDRHWVAVGERDDVVFSWEDNGWLGVDPNVVGPLAVGGSATSLYWNVNMVCRFVHAVEGSVVREFDPMFHDEPGPGGPPLVEERGLQWWTEDHPDVDFLATSLELVHRLTGMLPDPSWLTMPSLRVFGTVM
jgi:hypothetical protein